MTAAPAAILARRRVANRNRQSLTESQITGTVMQSTFDERNWLAWLVKVRILILTFLLGIELAVARFHPHPLPMRLFVSTIFLWYTISFSMCCLLSFWQEHRLQASFR